MNMVKPIGKFNIAGFLIWHPPFAVSQVARSGERRKIKCERGR